MFMAIPSMRKDGKFVFPIFGLGIYPSFTHKIGPVCILHISKNKGVVEKRLNVL